MTILHLTFPARPVDRHGYSRSQRLDGSETPRSELRGLYHPLRTEAEVISLRAARQAQRPCDSEPSGDAA